MKQCRVASFYKGYTKGTPKSMYVATYCVTNTYKTYRCDKTAKGEGCTLFL